MSSDKTLICRDCGTSFVFSAGEQDFYDRKGFTSAPSRCRDCRAPGAHGRGTAYGGSNGGSDPHGEVERPAPQLFAAVCSQCGQQTQVPAIVALGDAPIYCAPCTVSREDPRYASTGGWRDSW